MLQQIAAEIEQMLFGRIGARGALELARGLVEILRQQRRQTERETEPPPHAPLKIEF